MFELSARQEAKGGTSVESPAGEKKWKINPVKTDIELRTCFHELTLKARNYVAGNIRERDKKNSRVFF